MRVVILQSTVRSAPASAARASVLTHHPDAEVTVIPTAPDRSGALPDVGAWRGVDVHAALGPEWARWALLPGLARGLLRRPPGGDGPLVVLPDSAWVVGPLDALISAGDPATFVARRGGTSDLVPEVLSLGPGAGLVLDRWAEQAGDAVADPELDTSLGPWSRFVVAGEARVVTDAGLRLGPWIGLDAGVEGNGLRVTLDGVPVAIASFPGFDPHEAWWWPEGDRDGTHLSEVPAVRPLARAYATALLDAGWDEAASRPTTIEQVASRPEVRRRFRDELLTSMAGDGPAPPNAWVPGQEQATIDWLTSSGPGSPTGVSRIADAVWEARPDLHEVFAGVTADREPFVRWLWTHGLEEGCLPTALLPDVPSVSVAPTPGPARRAPAARPSPDRGGGSDGPRPAFGVNLVGYHRAELGLGVAVRRMADALDAADVPWTAIDYDRTSSRLRDATGEAVLIGSDGRAGSAGSAGAGPFAFNLILITPDQLGWFVNDAGPEFFADRYTIGLWYWETDVLPERTRAAFDQVDEVWGATEYLRAVFAAHTDRPVTLVPVPLAFDEPDRSVATRARLGLDDRFTFLFTFDFLSTMQRKNPLGLVEAYRRAFPTDDGTTRLVLKAINGDQCPRDSERLLDVISERDDIELWDRYLSADDRLSLVALADAFVSLHRSEGLGLTMAEAMWVGTPVIATAYSGNLDFMPPGASLRVDPLGCVPVGPGLIYPAEGRWADPDLDQAAAHLARIRTDPALRAELARAGRLALDEFTPERVGRQVRARLEQIWADR